jgi:hypothetical protein
MKKLVVSLLVLVCILLIGIYFFIPSDIKFSKLIIIKTKPSTAARFLEDENKWIKWFPKDSSNTLPNVHDKNIFRLKNSYYNIENALMNSVQVSISNDSLTYKSLMSLISIKRDSVAVEWKAESYAGTNPLKRVKFYFNAKEIQRGMTAILMHLKTFLESSQNVYGMSIARQKLVDSLLISTKFISNTYPTTAEIYSAINDLKEYISKEGAIETNPPMLNVSPEDTSYRVMVAIPINKQIKETDNFTIKKMIPGKILMAEVKGGSFATREALKQMNLYLNDNYLSSPAMPFESLITERLQEPDTTKWITKIYYPIY